jgi:hypothetical protein
MSAWTPERRQRQREAIQRWKPWQQSTGPRSPEGKARAARNAWTGGHAVKLRQTRQGTESGDARRSRIGLKVRHLSTYPPMRVKETRI